MQVSSSVAGDAHSRARRCLFIDAAYCLDELLKRQHLEFFASRESGGYFERVVGLHPIADRVCALNAPIVRTKFDDRQDIIEGSAEALKLPKWLLPLNVMISQRRLFKKMVKIIEDEGLDIIIATDALYCGLFGSWLKRATGKPLCLQFVTSYEIAYQTEKVLASPKLFPFKWVQDFVIRHVTSRADLILAGSRTLADYAIRMGARAEIVSLFSTSKNMTASSRLLPKDREPADDIFEEYGISDQTNTFITIARHATCKHVDHAIRAMSVVAARHPDARLLLAGEGPQTDELHELTKYLSLEHNVIFMGLTPQPILSRLTPHCIALSPLTGMALYETSMAGAPAIAYDADAMIGEIVIDGKTGYLVPYMDWRRLGEAASRLLDRPDQRKEFGAAMLAHARTITDLDTLHAAEASVFEALIRDREGLVNCR